MANKAKQVAERNKHILIELKAGGKTGEIAKKYNVSPTIVSNLKRKNPDIFKDNANPAQDAAESTKVSTGHQKSQKDDAAENGAISDEIKPRQDKPEKPAGEVEEKPEKSATHVNKVNKDELKADIKELGLGAAAAKNDERRIKPAAHVNTDALDALRYSLLPLEHGDDGRERVADVAQSISESFGVPSHIMGVPITIDGRTLGASVYQNIQELQAGYPLRQELEEDTEEEKEMPELQSAFSVDREPEEKECPEDAPASDVFARLEKLSEEVSAALSSRGPDTESFSEALERICSKAVEPMREYTDVLRSVIAGGRVPAPFTSDHSDPFTDEGRERNSSPSFHRAIEPAETDKIRFSGHPNYITSGSVESGEEYTAEDMRKMGMIEKPQLKSTKQLQEEKIRELSDRLTDAEGTARYYQEENRRYISELDNMRKETGSIENVIHEQQEQIQDQTAHIEKLEKELRTVYQDYKDEQAENERLKIDVSRSERLEMLYALATEEYLHQREQMRLYRPF